MSTQEGLQRAESRQLITWRQIKQYAPWIGLALAGLLLLGGLALGQLAVPLQIVILALFAASVVALRYDVVTCAVAIGVAILIDYYQLILLPLNGFPWVGLLMILAVLTLLFLQHTAERPWAALRDLRWWALLIVLVALAVPRSASLFGGTIYLINVIVVALCAWAVGALVITDPRRLRLFVNLLTVIAVAVAIQSIVYSRTHIFLLETPPHYAWLKSYHFFYLVGHPSTWRAGSFLLNPDTNGAYLGLSLFLPLGLLASTASWRWRIIHLIEAALIVVALLATYTASAFVAVAGGLLIFLALAFRPRQLLYALGGLVVSAGIALLAFSAELGRLHAHATAPKELALREGLWLTALNIIHAHPLTGIGLGVGEVYSAASKPYWSSMQLRTAPHPHNSFLELAALAGLPVLIAYLIVLARSGVRAFGNYRQADWAMRPLLAGVLAALFALTIHAFADSTWTIPVLVPIGWMLLGAVSSPKLREALTYDELTNSTPSTIPVRYPAEASEHAKQLEAQK